MSYVIAVTGGRDYQNRQVVYDNLDQYRDHLEISALITGMARGADTLDYQWSQSRGVPVWEFPANWERYGKAAGFRRNEQMIREGQPDFLIAFPGGNGTAHMVSKTKDAGILVDEIIPRAGR